MRQPVIPPWSDLSLPPPVAECPIVPTLQPVPYLPAPVLIVNVIPNYRTRKDLGLQGTDSVPYNTQQSPLVILKGPLNPNYGKDVAFLSLRPPLQVGGTEMPL